MFKLSQVGNFSDMSNLFAVSNNFNKNQVVDPAAKMYCYPHGILHNRQVDKDAAAAKQYMAVAGNSLYFAKNINKAF
nr:hypothetical protein [Rheinheimera oceanensis]